MTAISIPLHQFLPAAKHTLADGQTCFLGALDKNHIDEVTAFHNGIVKSLDSHEKAFLLQKTQSFFSDHFKNGHGNTVFCILNECGRLMGQAVVLHPTPQRPETGMVDMALPDVPQNLSVLQGVGVIPEMRGKGLMHLLARHWLQHAKQQGRTHALAEIATRNIASWRTFLDVGLNLVSTGTDPDDGTIVYNAHERVDCTLTKRPSCVFNAKAAVSPVSNIPEHQAFFQQGLRCVAYDKARRGLIFEQPI